MFVNFSFDKYLYPYNDLDATALRTILLRTVFTPHSSSPHCSN